MKENIPEELNKCIDDIENNIGQINYGIKINNIKQRLTSMFISFSLIITGWIVIPRLVKDINTIDCYPKTTKIYSSIKGLKENQEYSEVSKEEKDGIYLKVYGKTVELADNIYDREVTIYNVTDINVKSFKDYLNIDIEKSNIEGTKTQEIDMTNLTGAYLKEGYREVEEITIDRTKKEGVLNTSMYSIGLIVSYLIYITCLCYIEMMGLYYDASHIGILNNLIYILKNRNNMNEKELLVTQKELLMLIEKDKELRELFNKLYEENKHLLSNPEELINRINNLQPVIDEKEIKRLVKSRKNGA